MPSKTPPPSLSDWRSFNAYLEEQVARPQEAEPVPPTLGRYFQRDLSWLHFNDRVLSEAADDSVPPLERLRFAAIVSSNLDEFFMVRVAEIGRKAAQRRSAGGESGAQRLHSQIRDHVLRQKARQAAVLREILAVLAREGILVYSDFPEDPELDREIRERLPDLTFTIRRSSDPFPPLMPERIHVFVRFPEDYALITIGERAGRLMRLPSRGRTLRYALLERWLSARAREFFPTREVIEAFPFKLLRDADLRYHPDDEESLEEQIVEAVESRTKSRVVRLEVDAPNYSEGALFLASELRVDSTALYRFDLPLDLRTLATIYNVKSFSRLRYPPIQPQMPPVFADKGFFEAIAQRDVLLHHPYDSFDAFVRFLRTAARDPKVTRIYHTMYRTSRESPIMDALKLGVRRGKKVTAYVEIKARFDELNNVRWAEQLREAGAKVVRALGGFKVHCKMTLVVRNEGGKEVSYLHLGTGNYHPGTAKQYTDLGLFTRHEALGREAESYFRSMANRRQHPTYQYLMAAPTNLHDSFADLIRAETRIQRAGGKGHIIAKMNSLVDSDIIDALYEASQAGVKIELLVRGICCLRPGVKGLSENIRVVSVIDRFLEHSRVYYFRANGAKKIYLASADWMPRNFYARYELAFPILDSALKKFIREVVLRTSLHDNVKAWALRPDGNYDRVPTPADGREVRSQFFFEALARNRYRGTVLESRSAPPVFLPTPRPPAR